MNWNKARRYREAESKYAGTVRDNGQHVPLPPADVLARRAEWEFRRWSKRLNANQREAIKSLRPNGRG
jgi:hypothetical protein